MVEPLLTILTTQLLQGKLFAHHARLRRLLLPYYLHDLVPAT